MADREGELVGGKPARAERDIDVAGELLRVSYGRPAATAGRQTLADNERAFRSARAELSPDGRLLVDVFQQNVARLEAFTELQKANMRAEFAVGSAKKEREQGPSVLSEGRRQEAMESVRGWSDGPAPDHRVTQALQQEEPRLQR